MLMSTTIRVASRWWRPVADLARLADDHLMRTAARNAAAAAAEHGARRLEEARALHDLRRIGLADDGRPGTGVGTGTPGR